MSLKVKFEIHPLVAAGLIAGVFILAFALLKGCKQSRIEVAARQKSEQLADSALKALKNYKGASDSSAVDFQIKNELLTGQVELANNQKEKAETELSNQIKINNALLEKHKIGKYADTTATVVPAEYIQDCEGCFVNLEKTNKDAIKYKDDVNTLQDKLQKQDVLYKSRFKQLNEEKLSFYNKMNILAKQQKDAADKLKPHGRLYLSWGVLWKPFPWAAGAGMLYQTKENMVYGVKWYYSGQGHLIETTINFPLSIRIK